MTVLIVETIAEFQVTELFGRNACSNSAESTALHWILADHTSPEIDVVGMGVDTLETLNDVWRDVEELLECIGIVEAAQLTIVVVAWYTVIACALNVERWQGETTTVREQTIE